MRRGVFVALTAITLGVAFGTLLRESRRQREVLTTDSDTVAREQAVPSEIEPVRSEVVVMVVITKSSCSACNSPEFKRSIQSIADELRSSEQDSTVSLHVHGVAADERVGDGLRFLDKLYEFDEVSSGRGWVNSAAYRPFWASAGALPVVPQLLFVRESVEFSAAGVSLLRSDTVYRVEGLDAVRKLASEGKVVYEVEHRVARILERPALDQDRPRSDPHSEANMIERGERARNQTDSSREVP